VLGDLNRLASPFRERNVLDEIILVGRAVAVFDGGFQAWRVMVEFDGWHNFYFVWLKSVF
jgi:hypothetical protein